MATPRDIRRLALLALYQLDAVPGVTPADLRESIEDLEGLKEEGLELVDGIGAVEPKDKEQAVSTAVAAWEGRADADAEMTGLAPEWPTGRQAAIDRAILRLAHHEITEGGGPPKAVVNEAVELAKQFSTEKSPAFVNALLGKVLKRVHADATPEDEPETL